MSRPDFYGNPAGLTEDADVVRAIYAAFAPRDVGAALKHFALDCELHLRPTADAVGRTEPYRGHGGVQLYFADAERLWQTLELHDDDYRALPGVVIVLGRVHVRREDVTADRRVVWTWHLRDGKVTQVRVADTGELKP